MKIEIKEIDLQDLKQIDNMQQEQVELLDIVCSKILIPLVFVLSGILCGLLSYKFFV